MAPPRVAISMPSLSGHVNPALAVARRLVRSGCRVEFMCTSSSLREPVTATGASFHLAADWQPELYGGRCSEPPLGATGAVMHENGVVVQGTHAAAAFEARLKVANIMLEMQLPGMIRFLKHLQPHVVVYDAMVGGTRDAFYAAKLLGIPTVCILTVAGPGGNAAHLVHGSSQEAVRSSVGGFLPHLRATDRLREAYPQLSVPVLPEPVGMLEAGDSPVLVTTSAQLADPMSPDLAAAYEAQGASFHYLGPLLDEDGAPRAGAAAEGQGAALVARVRAVQSLPQVDVLRAGVDAFLTHGGQNSFTEAMANATPVVVCPGFGDQIINASRAEALGAGRKVDRPDCDAGMEQEAAATYRVHVAAALERVLSDPSCKAAAKQVALELESAGGVEAATKVILSQARQSEQGLLYCARNSGA